MQDTVQKLVIKDDVILHCFVHCYKVDKNRRCAQLSDHLYVMDNYFFMLLAVAIPHLPYVVKVRSRFLNPGKIVQR